MDIAYREGKCLKIMQRGRVVKQLPGGRASSKGNTAARLTGKQKILLRKAILFYNKMAGVVGINLFHNIWVIWQAHTNNN